MYTVTAERVQMHDTEWVVLKFVNEHGEVFGCRWHVDASVHEIAYALAALSSKLELAP